MMEYDPHRDDHLIAGLLKRSEHLAYDPAAPQHPSEELVAQFAGGELVGVERDELVEHLDACDECRELAAALIGDDTGLSLSEQSTPHETSVDAAEPVAYPGTTVRGRRWRLRAAPHVAAVAVGILVCVGLWLNSPDLGKQRNTDPGPGVLHQGGTYERASALLALSEFDRVEELIESARRAGEDSPRLRSLQAQARRSIPSPMALAFGGRLSDIGFSIGGLTARNWSAEEAARSESAHGLLAAAGDDELQVLLNRGHVLLTLNRPAEALEDFRKATERFPTEPLAWLGLGLAQFVSQEPTAAEASFRRTIELSPESIDARFNLALALEELGQWEDARGEWQTLARLPLTDDDRLQVEQALKWLKEQTP